jgi:hypothetical protein
LGQRPSGALAGSTFWQVEQNFGTDMILALRLLQKEILVKDAICFQISFKACLKMSKLLLIWKPSPNNLLKNTTFCRRRGNESFGKLQTLGRIHDSLPRSLQKETLFNFQKR